MKSEFFRLWIECETNLAMDFAVFGRKPGSSRFAAVEVKKISLFHRFMSSNAKESKNKINKNLTLYPDLMPTLAGNFRVSNSKLIFTTDSSIGCKGFTHSAQIWNWIGTSSPCRLCQGAEVQFQNQRAIRPCPRQPSFRRQEWTRHLVKFSILRLHLILFHIAAVINKLTNENTSHGCHIALPAFFQTTSVALTVDTAHKVEMATKSVAAAMDMWREGIGIRISNLTIFWSTQPF